MKGVGIFVAILSILVLLYCCNSSPLPRAEFSRIYNIEKQYHELKSSTLEELVEAYDDINTPNEAFELKTTKLARLHDEYISSMEKLTERQRHAYYTMKKEQQHREAKRNALHQKLESDLQ